MGSHGVEVALKLMGAGEPSDRPRLHAPLCDALGEHLAGNGKPDATLSAQAKRVVMALFYAHCQHPERFESDGYCVVAGATARRLLIGRGNKQLALAMSATLRNVPSATVAGVLQPWVSALARRLSDGRMSAVEMTEMRTIADSCAYDEPRADAFAPILVEFAAQPARECRREEPRPGPGTPRIVGAR
jgi:hypothetical protein